MHIKLFDLLISLSEAMDLVSPELVSHHKRVSYISYHLAKTIGLPENEIKELAIAGALHDVGGLSLSSRLATFDFELIDPDSHTLPGYLLLEKFKPFSRIASLVRYHHVYWDDGAGTEYKGNEVPDNSHIIHLADRIAVLIDGEIEILKQAPSIVRRIGKQKGRMFVPELVEAFEELAKKESFWFELMLPSVCTVMADEFPFGFLELRTTEFREFSVLFRTLIDFKSRFTITHSSGVAAVAAAIAEKAGFSPEECHLMEIAGDLHDIGKLAIPAELLEKASPLTEEDFCIIKKHPFLSYRILRIIDSNATFSKWVAYHHERSDGKGYPFHIRGEEIPLGARILVVADIFTALSEDRPYRKSMSSHGALTILDQMMEFGKVDPNVFELIRDDLEEINEIRMIAQAESLEEHNQFKSRLAELSQA